MHATMAWWCGAGWALTPPLASVLHDEHGALLPLGGLLAAPLSAPMAWSRISARLRQASALAAGQVVGVPYSADVPLLYYRR